MNRHFLRRLIRILKGRKTDDDTWTQHACDFLQITKHETMLDVAKEMLHQDAGTTIFCPLMMDMSHAFGPTTIRSVHFQMDEMREVRNAFPDRMLPFVALDPNNPEMTLLFQKAFSLEYNFFGVKIYPLLGYLPNHPKLMEVFEICEALDIPVTTHCGGNSTRVLGRNFSLPYCCFDANGQRVEHRMDVSFMNEDDKANYFNDPQRWLPVLQRYPKLRLNLAHFGGEDAWKDFARHKPDTAVHKIVELMECYENVYADVSYVLHLAEKKQTGFLDSFEALLEEKERVRNRTLFGSDYYMVVLQEKLPLVTRNMLIRLSDDLVEKLTFTNPRSFLNI